MPTSKQARAAQSRQMDRLAAQNLEREQQQKKRRIVITIASVVGVAALLVILVASGAFDSKGGKSAAPPTSASTVAPVSAKDKPCVPVADVLPAGAPVMNIPAGPPPTELVKEDIEVGTGAEVQPGASVTAKYVGVACSTGKIFDESFSKEPIEFSLNGVVKGWADGIPGMKVGGKRLLGIPSEQGYGASGQGSDIAPDEALWFVVEVTDTKPAAAG